MEHCRPAPTHFGWHPVAHAASGVWWERQRGSIRAASRGPDDAGPAALPPSASPAPRAIYNKEAELSFSLPLSPSLSQVQNNKVIILLIKSFCYYIHYFLLYNLVRWPFSNTLFDDYFVIFVYYTYSMYHTYHLYYYIIYISH